MKKPREFVQLALCCAIGLFLLSACVLGNGAHAAPHTPTAPATPRFSAPAPASHTIAFHNASSATSTPHPPTVTPTPTSPPPPACLQKPGTIQAGWLPDKALPTPMAVLVYLPPCYHEHKNQTYPVLYLLHGQGYSQQQWVRLGATRTADRLIAAGEAPPFIIVMPRELVWKDPPKTGFDEAFLRTLMPWVDNTFRTRRERRYRAIGGLSRGAAWAIHFGLQRWDLFGSIGAHSPPVFWSDVNSVKRWLFSIPYGKWPRIYMDIGNKDTPEIMDSAVWFEKEVLTPNGIPHEWHLNQGMHNEKYWSGHVEEYLQWYTAPWKENEASR